MANNRLYLKCKVCGEELYLGKRFLEAYYWTNYWNDGEHLEDKLNEFYEKHCGECAFDCDTWLDCFELEYEHEPKVEKGERKEI